MNGLELFVAMGLLALGTIFARPAMVAPAFEASPAGAPPILPFIFITIACGAISGFHSLVGSGTTSKQICNESHACAIGYGAMLMEGLLAVFVIIAVAGGIGLDRKTLVWKEGREGAPSEWVYAKEGAELEPGARTKEVSGRELWSHHYRSWAAAKGLGSKIKAFVDGSANMLRRMGIPEGIALAIMGVFVSSFAATTLDTATRLQRYVVGEFGKASGLRPLERRHAATLVAVVTAGALALADFKNPGKGGLILWPLFGAGNQLLACLALLVVTTYLKKTGKPIWFTLLPAAVMFVITGAAMVYNVIDFYGGGLGKLHLLAISAIVIALELWMIAEALGVLFGKGQSGPPGGVSTGPPTPAS
jgi:carbon starvation protein